MNPWKGRVLRIFGLVIRPANWIIFGAGVVIMALCPFLLTIGEQDPLTTGVLFVSGLQMLVAGYGEVKDDELED